MKAKDMKRREESDRCYRGVIKLSELRAEFEIEDLTCKWGCCRSTSVSDSMSKFTRLLLPSILYQSWRDETSTLYSRVFSMNAIFLAGPAAFLLRIPFINDLFFPSLLLVNNRSPRYQNLIQLFVFTLPRIIACVLVKLCQSTMRFDRCVAADVGLVFHLGLLIWWKPWRKATTFDRTLHGKLLFNERYRSLLRRTR